MNPSALIAASFIASLSLSLGAVVAQAETVSPALVWNFDHEQPGTLPSEFSIGALFDGRPAGDWQILATDRAKSPPHVLAQLMAKGAEHAYKVVLLKEVIASDLNLEVSFLPIRGQADMGGGLIWRATDDRNYYLTRANPLEQNIRVYRIVNGIRHLLQNFDQTITLKQWHTLRVTHQDCRVNIFYDDKKVLDLCDKTFHTGMIGLWTKSDAVTYFDDLQLQHVNAHETMGEVQAENFRSWWAEANCPADVPQSLSPRHHSAVRHTPYSQSITLPLRALND